MASTDERTASQTLIERQWENWRCRTCQRLLMKLTPQAGEVLKPGAALEIKCACKTLNYLMGA